MWDANGRVSLISEAKNPTISRKKVEPPPSPINRSLEWTDLRRKRKLQTTTRMIRAATPHTTDTMMITSCDDWQKAQSNITECCNQTENLEKNTKQEIWAKIIRCTTASVTSNFGRVHFLNMNRGLKSRKKSLKRTISVFQGRSRSLMSLESSSALLVSNHAVPAYLQPFSW